MRNVVYAINLNPDGCRDHTKFNSPDDEVLEHYTHLLRDFDLLVYGRKTYQLMVPYWPDIAKASRDKADIEFAQTFVSRRRIVFHDRWPALKMKIRELFVRTFATNNLN